MCGFQLPTGPHPHQLGRPDTQIPAKASKTTPPEEPALSLPSELAKLEGEKRTITVVLADVARSTDLLEQIGTEAWVSTISQVLQTMEVEIYRYGGHVDQFRGDGLVAFFGAVTAHEDDPERAVLASLAIQEALKPLILNISKEQDVEVQARVGVNTGEVILGNIGDSRHHQEETAMGEAVALAARLETAAEPGTVLVSENTYRLITSLFEWQPLGEIQLKGIREAVKIYRPLKSLAEYKQPPRLQAYGLSAPLVGREESERILFQNIAALSEGRSSIVLVTGDKGIGKSHLVRTVRLKASKPFTPEDPKSPGLIQPVNWLQGRCRSYHETWPYSMWIDLLQNWLDATETTSEEEISQRLVAKSKKLWGEEAETHLLNLFFLLSIPLNNGHPRHFKNLDAEGLRQQIFNSMRSWVAEMACQQSLVLAFADVQWADSTSLELLEYCLSLTDNVAIMWLIVFRPKRGKLIWGFQHRVETEYPHRVTTITLPTLTETQSAEVIDQLIGPDVLPEETRDLVVQKSEGVPYYIEELILSLIENNVLVQDPWAGKWHATRAVANLELPDTLQSLLLSRFSNLSAEQRKVLQVAAVIGSFFWSGLLETLVEEKSSLQECLTALQKAQMIYERGRVHKLGAEYGFSSNLIREAVYEGILKQQRLKLHQQVAENLEQLIGEEIATHGGHYDGLLAYHYQKAGNKWKEFTYVHRSAQQARDAYANAEALDLLSRGLELLDQLEAETETQSELRKIFNHRFDVYSERRSLYYITGNLEAGREDARKLLPIARQLPDEPTRLIDALLHYPGVANWSSRAELRSGLPMAREALRLSRQIGDKRREMQSLRRIAAQLFEFEDPSGHEHAEAALAIAREIGDQYTEARILLDLSGIFSWSTDPNLGKEYLKAALPLYRNLDDKVSELDLLNLISLHYERAGDYYRSLVECQQVRVKRAREIGHRLIEASALLACSRAEGIYLGNYKTGLELAKSSQKIYQGTAGERYPLLRMVWIYTALKQFDLAETILKQLQQIRVPAGRDLAEAAWNLAAANLAISKNDEESLNKALEWMESTIHLLVDRPFISRQIEMAAACKAAIAHLHLARLVTDPQEKNRHNDQALTFSTQAINLYKDFGYSQMFECLSEELLYYHSQALLANLQEEEAAKYLKAAYDEMTQKHLLIPPDTQYRKTYLENIPLHKTLLAAYQTGEPKSKKKAQKHPTKP